MFQSGLVGEGKRASEWGEGVGYTSQPLSRFPLQSYFSILGGNI